MTDNDIQNSPERTIIVADDLKELKDHGDFEYPVGVYEINLKNMYMEMVRWHWHDEIEFVFVNEGCGEFCVSDDTYILSEGQGVLINQGVLHSFHIAEGHENCIYTSIVFHPSFLFAYGQAKLCSFYLHPIISNSAMASLVLPGDDDFQLSILELIKQIILVNQEQKYCYELYTKDYLIRIWILLLEKRSSETTPMVTSKGSKISMDEARAKEAIRYIEEHYANPISLDDIAASIHVSKSECCRCIRRCMKMTPFEYLMKYRIFVAAGILCDGSSDDSIATLASRVGFNSSSYFNKLFRKYLKCTPTQYKAKQMAEMGKV
ncbi:MAG: helix-turn-helix domain-containing protein [Lachnospiraceae bacterium]